MEVGGASAPFDQMLLYLVFINMFWVTSCEQFAYSQPVNTLSITRSTFDPSEHFVLSPVSVVSMSRC